MVDVMKPEEIEPYCRTYFQNVYNELIKKEEKECYYPFRNWIFKSLLHIIDVLSVNKILEYSITLYNQEQPARVANVAIFDSVINSLYNICKPRGIQIHDIGLFILREYRYKATKELTQLIAEEKKKEKRIKALNPKKK